MKIKCSWKKLTVFLLTLMLLAMQISLGSLSLVSAAGTGYTGSTQNYNWTAQFYTLTDNSTGNDMIAYCYDPEVTSPPAGGYTYDQSGVITTASVRSMMYNGYPVNGGGLQQKFGLSSERFRYVTQLALKHIRNGTNYYWGWWGGLDSQEEEYCYKLLAGVLTSVNYNGQTITKADTPADFVVRRYTPSGGWNYQSLIVAEMLDAPDEYPVYFSKRDAEGQELAGAEIQIQTADGTVVEEWISTGETHKFEVTPGRYKFL
jgi:TQXA domain-containing protein